MIRVMAYFVDDQLVQVIADEPVHVYVIFDKADAHDDDWQRATSRTGGVPGDVAKIDHLLSVMKDERRRHDPA